MHLDVNGLEIAAGYDGLLRGAPEPVLVCGLFALRGNESVLIGRGIGRFSQPRTFPTTVLVSDPTLIEARRPTAEPSHLAVILIAVEEDRGQDIQRAYAMLQAHTELLILETSDAPIAADIQELLTHPQHWQHPRKVDLIVDGTAFGANFRSDKWIGASAFVTKIRIVHRAHFISTDLRNDWTAIVALR